MDLTGPRSGPFNSEDEVIITITIQCADCSLCIFPAYEIDKPKSSAHVCVLVKGHVGSGYSAERMEQLHQILFAGVLRQVSHTYRVLVVPPTPHV